jgi:uncharacterized protein YndB with AHSA1/START domain
MIDEVSIMRLIQGSRQEVFNNFITPELLEAWAYPEGLKLRVPFFEPKIGGTYRFEHTGKDGLYVCTGFVKDFQPGSKLVQVDTVKDPDGKIIFSNLETVTTFSDKPGGTFITITIRGFANEALRKECEYGWNQCLDRLDSIFSPSQSASL